MGRQQVDKGYTMGRQEGDNKETDARQWVDTSRHHKTPVDNQKTPVDTG